MPGTRRALHQTPPRGATAVASSPWILVSVGVGALVVLLIIALGAYRGPGAGYDPAPPVGAAPLPDRASASREASVLSSQVVPGLSPRRTDPPSTVGAELPPSTAGAGRPPPEPSSTTKTSPPSPVTAASSAPTPAPVASPPSPLEARYRVTDTFSGGFIAEVLIRNTARRNRPWEARIEYPRGRVVTAWLEGVPQGTFSAVDGTLIYRSGPELAAGSAVTLRFHIESAAPRPASCTVSGRACDGL